MPTIHEIAREAEVSIATVSRVFSNHPNVKEELRERVLRVARAHDYYPRLSNRRRTVILITPSRSEHPVQNYVDMVVSHLAEASSRRGYRIEILSEDGLDKLDNTQFCGAIQISSGESPWKNWGRRFDAPLVIIDREVPGGFEQVTSVRSNEEQGMELAIDYLYRLGHRRIGCLISNSRLGNPQLRMRCLEESLTRRGLPAESYFLRLASEVEYVEEVGKLLRHGVDAIFAPGGSGGIITAYALSLYGKRIPEEISLISSERVMVSRYCVPSQTTITQDYSKLASIAVDAIDAALRRDSFPRETILDYQLIERNSVIDRKPA
ncbi:LacI family DNA-binding transcriptional regulator [Ruficoccus sp. ZRK36]|uniref:LacI family DNA-binding transcriptional regulator n=1 Tax=Ruficoccus sp. ZRK36 TaxID=2866311 RepID=UPI001C73215C|nr:LacI family DNA-binding transcriptional regulator [Ruficoccus sp. ZRK36]QYY34308.1 LacI family transcriptional regulator [Ruficoccus sp. ZRK36]